MNEYVRVLPSSGLPKVRVLLSPPEYMLKALLMTMIRPLDSEGCCLLHGEEEGKWGGAVFQNQKWRRGDEEGRRGETEERRGGKRRGDEYLFSYTCRFTP